MMKKSFSFLMMAFLSVVLLAMVSCSKDNDEEESVSLVGTHWVGTQTFSNIPLLGSIAISADLQFVSETRCVAEIGIVPEIPSVDLPAGEFDYTFDGKKMVTIVTNSSLVGNMALEYQGNTMTYNLPTALAAMAGGATQFVLVKQQ